MSDQDNDDTYEEIEEEVERNVRESPKDKPPRRDKERRHIDTDDPDIEGDPDTSEDKDLSMNRKDIGGSASPESIARRFVRHLTADEDEGSQGDQGGQEEGGDDQSQEDKDDDTSEPDQDQGDSDDGENNEKDDLEDAVEESEISDTSELEEDITLLEDSKLDSLLEIGDDDGDKDVIDRVVDHALMGPESDLSKPAEKLAHGWYEHSPEELSSVLISNESDSKEKTAAKYALQFKMNPLPPKWDADEAFESGMLTLEARQRFRKHMSEWREETFAENMDTLKEEYLADSIMDGSDIVEDYHNSILDLVQEEYEKQIEGAAPVDDLNDLLPEGVDKANDIDFEEKHREKIKRQVEVWKDRLRVTSQNTIRDLVDEVRSKLDNLDDHLSVTYAWYAVLWDVLKGSLVMAKMSDHVKESSVRKVASRYIVAEYRGLPGYLPDDDHYKPDQPKWQKVDPFDFQIRDYVRILSEAREWLQSGYFDELLAYDPEHACRNALDYAIYDSFDGIYAGSVDAPTYHDLLDVLKTIEFS